MYHILNRSFLISLEQDLCVNANPIHLHVHHSEDVCHLVFSECNLHFPHFLHLWWAIPPFFSLFNINMCSLSSGIQVLVHCIKQLVNLTFNFISVSSFLGSSKSTPSYNRLPLKKACELQATISTKGRTRDSNVLDETSQVYPHEYPQVYPHEFPLIWKQMSEKRATSLKWAYISKKSCDSICGPFQEHFLCSANWETNKGKICSVKCFLRVHNFFI